ncbi:hypothetical protein AB1Y20_001481 [Prymnesium parvum]|uniref:Serine hydrolase domain-containing protein n=1 Tax=Prymnesium parvum TaxID=97485 RepID=A0AB34KCP1_PRYPA
MAARPRFLCLHGYGQNGAFFRTRTGALRKALKSADFYFLDAPYTARASFIQDEALRGAALSWWDFEKRDSRPSKSEEYVGLEAALERVRLAIERDGPFDGILGFSQGATLAAMLCLLPPAPPPVKLVVLVAAFLPQGADMRAHFQPRALELPSLHIMGEDDQLVPMASSAAVADCFIGQQTVTHPGGHAVPASAPVRNALKCFVEKALSDCSGSPLAEDRIDGGSNQSASGGHKGSLKASVQADPCMESSWRRWAAIRNS